MHRITASISVRRRSTSMPCAATGTRVVGQFHQGPVRHGQAAQGAVVQGTAKFVSANELEIADADDKTQLLRFANCIIAAGSQPVKLPFFPWDDKRVMDSTDALDLADAEAARGRRRHHRRKWRRCTARWAAR